MTEWPSLRWIGILESIVFHQGVQIDHGEGAVFGLVSELCGRHSLLQDTLQDHAVQGAVPHSAVVLKQIRLGMGSKIYGLLRCHPIVGDESIRPLLRLVTESLLVHVHPPEFDNRSVLEDAAHAAKREAAFSKLGHKGTVMNLLFPMKEKIMIQLINVRFGFSRIHETEFWRKSGFGMTLRSLYIKG